MAIGSIGSGGSTPKLVPLKSGALETAKAQLEEKTGAVQEAQQSTNNKNALQAAADAARLRGQVGTQAKVTDALDGISATSGTKGPGVIGPNSSSVLPVALENTPQGKKVAELAAAKAYSDGHPQSPKVDHHA